MFKTTYEPAGEVVATVDTSSLKDGVGYRIMATNSVTGSVCELCEATYTGSHVHVVDIDGQVVV
jgi:hypothetical protein